MGDGGELTVILLQFKHKNVSSMAQRPSLFSNYLHTTTECAVFMDFYTLNATQLAFLSFAHLQLKNSTLNNTRVSPTRRSFKMCRRNKIM